MYADCVRIVDKFLNTSDLKSVIDHIRGMKWEIQSSSKNRGLMFLYEEVTDQEFFNTYLCNKIREELKIDNQLERIYFNGQWSGREGSFHIDGCDKTVLIYIGEYHEEWGGFLHIKSPKDNEHIISPIQNRMVVFPGNWRHKAFSYSFQDAPMRISLAYKFK